MPFETDAEIFGIGESRQDRDLGDGQVRLPEQLGRPFQPDVHDELLDRHARDVVDLLVEERASDRHVRHERIHIVVAVVHVPFDIVHRLFQQFLVHRRNGDLRRFGDVLLAVTLLEFLLAADEVGNLFEQEIHIEGLVDEHVGSAFQCLDLVFGVFAQSRKHDHRDMAGLDVRTQRAAYLEAVGFGHHQVGDDDLGADSLRFGDAFAAVCRGVYVVVFRQPLFEVAPQVGVVLDDHDVARLAVVPVVGSHDVGFGQQVVDFGDRVFVRFGGAVGLFGVEREGQDHRERDFRVARTEGDGSVEVADQLLDDGQSQAAAALELGTGICY